MKFTANIANICNANRSAQTMAMQAGKSTSTQNHRGKKSTLTRTKPGNCREHMGLTGDFLLLGFIHEAQRVKKQVSQVAIGLRYLTCQSSRSTMTYTYLIREERCQIQSLHLSGQNDAQIGRPFGRHRSTIGRERKLASSEQGYVAAQAQALAVERQRPSRNARAIDTKRWQQVQRYVRLWLSPEQICGRLALEGERPVSHESIYLHIYRDQDNGGDLLSYLRCQKKRRKRYGSGHDRRGALTNRVGIEHRPAVVQSRQRIGDWEGETVIGKGHKGVLVTLVERKSRSTLARALPCSKAEVVQEAIIELMRPHKQHCLTITFDNGKEFAEHEFIGQCLDASVYFAWPYHSWERGTNENTNGLLRQFFPEEMSLLGVSDIEVNEALYRLNHRPRKCLGSRTPHEVFFHLQIHPLN